MINYEHMALSLANLSSIPVRLYRDGQFAGLFHTSKFKPDLAILEEPNIFKSSASVSYYMTEEFLIYGLFRVKQEPVSLVLGPVAQLPVDRERARRILLSIGESPKRASELQNYIQSIPHYSLRMFMQILCTFECFINGEMLTIGDILTEGLDLPEVAELPSRKEENAVPNHNTYAYEQTLLSYIEHGRPDELEKFFQMPAIGRAGNMAHDMIRQQKNLLIVTATLCSRAAIRGGMDPETAFSLSDIYIQKAELLDSYKGITKMSVQMTMDYAQKVAALHCGDSNRKIIRDARAYILMHINERITTERLAAVLNRNRSYVCSCFKEETGLSVNDYITRIKIDEAKRLLKVTDMPLGAIAQQVGYATQNYFQTVFKRVEGITPLEYRRNGSL